MAGMTLEQAHRDGFRLVRAHTERFVAYVRELSAAEADTPVPGLSWTAGETVTHVRAVYERYTSDLQRAATPRDLATQNAADVARLGADVHGAAKGIEEQVAALAPVVDHIAPDRRFPFHAGQEVTLAAGWGNLLGELLAHGDDVARATGRPFAVPAADLEITWRFLTPALQGWLRHDARSLVESWDLRFPFGVVRLVLDSGQLRVAQDEQVADEHQGDHHTIDIGDAAGFALQFPYRRRPIRDPSTALLASRFLDV